MKLDIQTLCRLSPSDVAEMVVDYNRDLSVQAEKRERFCSLISGLESLNQQDRIVVINYLRQDPTIASMTGEDPELYYDRLKEHHDEISNEFVALTALAGLLVGWFLHKYRDTFYALRKSLSSGTVPEDEWLTSNTTSRLVLSYDTFKTNDTLLENGYKALRALLSKKDPQEADFLKVTQALGLNKAPSRTAGQVVKGGILGILAGTVVGIFTHLGFTAPLAAVLILGAGLTVPIVSAILTPVIFAQSVLSWFVAWRVGSNVSNKNYISFANKGWTSKTVEWARQRCIAQIKNMDDLATSLKSMGEMDPQKQKAVKNLADILANGVQGLCISTSRILK